MTPMHYNKLTTPCDECPFLESMSRAFSAERLEGFASGAFHCHKTGTQDEETGDYIATRNSAACAGALIYLEKRGRSNQMMRIAERLGSYDLAKLDMDAPVREEKKMRRKKVRVCSVSGDDCLAPAGWGISGSGYAENDGVSCRGTCFSCGEPVCGKCSRIRTFGKRRRICERCEEDLEESLTSDRAEGRQP